MSAPSLIVRRLEIERALDVERSRRFEYTDLAPGVNLIHGPNGSGKSLTASALHELIWPGSSDLDRPTLAGRFDLGDERWEVEIVAGAARYRRDGVDAERPTFDSSDARHRYRLALDELVRPTREDDAFARAVREESQGGYDLDRAMTIIAESERRGAPGTLRNDLKRSTHAVQEAQERQRQVQRESESLDALRAERDAAAAAATRADRVDEALELLRIGGEIAALESALAARPGGMDALQGNERERLERIDERSAALRTEQRELEERIAVGRAAIEEAGLPDADIDAVALKTARERARELRAREEVAHDRRQAVAVARTGLESARAQFTAGPDGGGPDTWKSVDQGAIGRAATVSRQLRSLDAQRTHLEDELARLGADDAGTSGADAETCRRGLVGLTDWLAHARAATGRSRFVLVCLVVAITALLVAGVTGWLVHGIGWLALAGVAIVLAIVAVVGHRTARPAEREVPILFRDDADLAPPEQWTIDAVTTRLVALAREADAAARREAAGKRRADLGRELERQEAQRAAAERESAGLASELGVRIDGAEDALPALIDVVRRWHAAQEAFASAETAVAMADAAREELGREINVFLVGSGREPVQGALSAEAALDDLAERVHSVRQAVESIRNAESAIRHRGTEQATLERERAEIFAAVGLEIGRDAELERRLEVLPQHRRDRLELVRLEGARTTARRALRGFEDLLELSNDELAQAKAAATEQEQRVSVISEQIGGIGNRIDAQRRGHDLADALHARQEAVERLEERRDAAMHDAVRGVIARHVREKVVAASTPAVFRHAQEILSTITARRYRLELAPDHDEPSFRVYDADLDRWKGLDELSVGERVQVLIAVRMGFVEHEEREGRVARLPLVMDETLGTSDDERASLIIDAVIALAREGRQVFYMTAQADEIAKWSARLRHAGLAAHVIDLRQVRSLGERQHAPLYATSAPDDSGPPPPGNRSHGEYGELLGVPGLVPAEPSARVHLWHLVDDPHRLHALLELGVERCGRLREATTHENPGALGLEDDLLVRTVRRLDAIERLFNAWRIGRGRPVDRAVLVELREGGTSVVTDSFIDRVSALAAQCDGDAGRLLAGLEGKAVKRWRENNTERLRAALDEDGFLDERERLDATSLRLRAVGGWTGPLDEDDRAWLERLIANLPDIAHAGGRAAQAAEPKPDGVDAAVS